MSRSFIAAALIALLAGCADDDSGGGAPLTEVRVDAAGGVTFVVDGRETFSTAGGVPRLRWFDETTNFVVGQWDFQRDPDSVVTMDLSEVTAVRESDTGVEVDYALPSGTASATLLVTHPRPGATSELRLTVNADPRPDSIALPVRCDAAAGFHGFGAQYNATDQRGEAFRLFVSEQGLGRDPNLAPLPVNGGPHTTYFPMPYFVDPRGFGALVRTAQRVEVDLCKSDPAVGLVRGRRRRTARRARLPRADRARRHRRARRSGRPPRLRRRTGPTICGSAPRAARDVIRAKAAALRAGRRRAAGRPVGAGLDGRSHQLRRRLGRAVPLGSRPAALRRTSPA